MTSVTSVKPPSKRPVFWSTAGTAVTAALNVGMLYALSRVMSTSDLGVIMIAVIFLDMVLLFAEMGIGNALIRELTDERSINSTSERESLCHTAFWIVQGLILIVAIVFALTGQLWGWVFHHPGLPDIMPWMALSLIPLGWTAIQRDMLQAQGRFKAFAVSEVTSMIVAIVATLPLVMNGWGPNAYFIGFFARKVAQTMMTWHAAQWAPRALPWQQRHGQAWNQTIAKRLLRFGSQTSAGYMLGYGVRPVETAIVSWFLNPAQFGIYAFASLMVYFPVNKLSFALNRVFIAKLSTLRYQPEDFWLQFQNQSRLKLSLSFGTMVSMALLMPWIVGWAFPVEWVALGTIVPILTLYGAMTSIIRLSEPLAVPLGRPKILMGLNIFLLFSIGASFSWLAPTNLTQAAWAMVWAHIPATFASLLFMVVMLRSKRREQSH